MIDYIEKAKAFAMMAHKGQTDKAEEDYFTAHVAVVADGVEPDPLVKASPTCTTRWRIPAPR